jgi:hypothetical protein
MERDVTAVSITKPMATIAKVVATIAVIPLVPLVLKVLLYRYSRSPGPQELAAYLLVLLPFWIALWRRGVAPARRVMAFAAGLGNGALIFLAGDPVKGLVVARAPDPQFRLVPFISYLALTFASWIVAGFVAYWIAAPTNSAQK